MIRFLRTAYAPLFLFGFIATACWLVARQVPLWTLIPLLVLAIIVSFGMERWLPFKAEWNRNQGDSLRDCLHALCNEGLNCLSLMALPWFARWLPDLGLWPEQWPFVVQVIVTIILADLGITLMHWASHRNKWLWRLHAVHHSPQRLYGFNGLMKHPLHQLLEALAGIGPLLLLGLPENVAGLLAFAIAIQLLLQHSNVDIRVGYLDRLFAWAPVHRYHHIKYGRAGDVNFALFFSFWELLVGTAFTRSGCELRSSDLGIGSQPDYPKAYLQQLAQPFKRPASKHPEPRLPCHLGGVQAADAGAGDAGSGGH